MSLLNRNFLTPDGMPITGRTPTQIIVHGSGPLSDQQRAMVEHAYKLFCDNVRLSPAANGYHVQNRQLPDGTRMRMESNGGLDRVMVWPEGDEEFEVMFLASPRGIYPSTPFTDGVAAKEVSLFSWKKSGVRLLKHELFSAKPDGTTALEQQPGNNLWVDMRPGGTKHILSWWADQRLAQPDFDVARFDSAWANRKEFWNPSTKNRLYLDGEKLVDVDFFMVVGAGMWRDPSGEIYVRVVCMEFPDDDNSLYLYQFKPSQAGTPGLWTSSIVVLGQVSFRPISFDMSGAKFAALYTTSGGSTLTLAEVDFATGTPNVIHSGSRTYTGAPSVTPYDGIAGFGQSTFTGWDHTRYEGITWIDGASAAQTQTRIYNRSGVVACVSKWVMGFGYDAKNALRYYEGVLEDVTTATETWRDHTDVTGDQTWTLVAVNSPATYDRYNRRQQSTYGYTLDDDFSLSSTRQFSLVQRDTAGQQKTVFQSEVRTPYSLVYQHRFAQTGTYDFTQYDLLVPTGTPPNDGIWETFPTITTVTNTTTHSYNNDAWVSEWFYVAACDPRSDYLALGGLTFAVNDVITGKIAQTVSLREYSTSGDPVEIRSTTKREFPGADSWAPFNGPIVAHITSSPASPQTLNSAVPANGGYNGWDFLIGAAYTFSASPIVVNRKAKATVASGLVGNTMWRSQTESDIAGTRGTGIYNPITWTCGPPDQQSVYEKFKTDTDWGFPVCDIVAQPSHKATNAVIKSLSLSADAELPDGKFWLSSPIYIDTWKIPK